MGEATRIEIPQGYLDYRIGSGQENLEVWNLFIKEGERRKGYGTQLMREVERIARDRGLACIYLFTRSSNKGAQNFYEKLGYQKIAEIPGFYRSEPGILYVKRL